MLAARGGAYVRGLLTAYGATQEVDTHLHLLGELNLVAADELARVRLQNDEIGQTLINMLMSMPMAPEFDP